MQINAIFPYLHRIDRKKEEKISQLLSLKLLCLLHVLSTCMSMDGKSFRFTNWPHRYHFRDTVYNFAVEVT